MADTPDNSDKSNHKGFILNYDIEDIPWLIHALQIQANSLLGMGGKTLAIREKITKLKEQVKEVFPVLKNYCIEEEVWFDLMRAVKTAKTWGVKIDAPHFSNYSTIVICVDAQDYKIVRYAVVEHDFVEQICEIIEQFTPLDSQKLPDEDITGLVKRRPFV